MSPNAHRDLTFERTNRPRQCHSRFILSHKGFLLSRVRPSLVAGVPVTGVCFASVTVIVSRCWELGGETYTAPTMFIVTR